MDSLGFASLRDPHRQQSRDQHSTFRSLNTILLKVHPIFHWWERRVRAHLSVCLRTTWNGTCGGA